MIIARPVDPSHDLPVLQRVETTRPHVLAARQHTLLDTRDSVTSATCLGSRVEALVRSLKALTAHSPGDDLHDRVATGPAILKEDVARHAQTGGDRWHLRHIDDVLPDPANTYRLASERKARPVVSSPADSEPGENAASCSAPTPAPRGRSGDQPEPPTPPIGSVALKLILCQRSCFASPTARMPSARLGPADYG